MAEFVNTRLDRYELKERIGTGGMARVYKAWDTVLDRPVAVKILHEHLAEDPNLKERFEREAKFVASFNHPNIVQVFDFNVIEREGFPLYYMVMSYIPGKTLRQHIEDLAKAGERMKHEEVLQIMTNLTDALGYAHARGMVHRDVKPGNVILNEHGQAVLTDFGIARLMESARLTQEGLSSGTPAYMSPEQASGLPGDVRSDIYALGVMLFEMLAGRPPFADEGGLSLMLKHLNAPVPPVSQFLAERNPAMDAVIFRAMAKNPDDRYPTAKDFADDIQAMFAGENIKLATQTMQVAALAGGQTTVLIETPDSQALAARQPRTRLLGALAAVAIVIALIFAAAFFTRPTAPPTTGDASAPTVAAMTGGAIYFGSTFSADDKYNSDWPQNATGTVISAITPDGFYHLSNHQPSTASATLFNPIYEYDDVTITMAASLDAASENASAYGIVFRYVNDRQYNVFAVDGLGRYSVWVREVGDNGVARWRELRGLGEQWTPDDKVNPIGQSNRLSIDIQADVFSGYVNGKRVFRLTGAAGAPSGNIGIYVATYIEGRADVAVDSYRVVSRVPSMTGPTSS